MKFPDLYVKNLKSDTGTTNRIGTVRCIDTVICDSYVEYGGFSWRFFFTLPVLFSFISCNQVLALSAPTVYSLAR